MYWLYLTTKQIKLPQAKSKKTLITLTGSFESSCLYSETTISSMNFNMFSSWE